MNENIEIVKLFLKFKADFSSRNQHKETLWEAATFNCENVEIIEFLKQEIGLNINHRDENEWTPLHDAAQNNGNLLKCLQELGADLNAKDENGVTPLWCLLYGALAATLKLSN